MINQLGFSRSGRSFGQTFALNHLIDQTALSHITAAYKSVLRPFGLRTFSHISITTNKFGFGYMHAANLSFDKKTNESLETIYSLSENAR